MREDDRGERIDLPSTKPHKSKKNPNPPLSEEQKAPHKALSQMRIFIEQAMGGMKRYPILVHVFRNRLQMMHRDGWNGPRASSAIPFAWFCWDRNHRGPAVIDRIGGSSGEIRRDQFVREIIA